MEGKNQYIINDGSGQFENSAILPGNHIITNVVVVDDKDFGGALTSYLQEVVKNLQPVAFVLFNSGPPGEFTDPVALQLTPGGKAMSIPLSRLIWTVTDTMI